MRGFYTGAKLRWLMEGESWPGAHDSEFQSMVAQFQAAFGHGAHRSRFVNVLTEPLDTETETEPQVPSTFPGSEEKSLPHDVYQQLLRYVNSSSCVQFASLHDDSAGSTSKQPFLPDTADFVSRTNHLDVAYATRRRRGLRYSFILFRIPGSGSNQVVAGQIDSIFHHTRLEGETPMTETFFLVDEYAQLSVENQLHDPYRKFLDGNTWLCYNRFRMDKRLLRLSDIVSHFAALEYTPEEIGEACIVVRSLDRVSISYTYL